MGMKNDLSFLLENRMNLYEHQSSWNPNMPLRGLFYFSRLYQSYVVEHDLDIYSQVRLLLPAPKYLVFFNGARDMPDRLELKLSDSFFPRADEDFSLECRVTVMNINFGHNQKLMESCRKLYEYSYLIAKIRECLAGGVTLTAAVDQAVTACIREGILADFLKKHRAEVNDMILTEYNEELHIRSEKSISYQEGFAAGEAQGEERGEERSADRINRLTTHLIRDNRLADLARAAEDPQFQKTLLAEYGIE